MRRTHTAAIGLTLLAGLGAWAHAQPLLPLDPAGLDLPAPRTSGATPGASGGLYGTVITVHSETAGVLLDSAPDVHVFGSSAFMGLNTLSPGRSMHATTSQTQVAPGVVEFVIEWGMDDGGVMIPAGATLGDDEAITAIGFHVGEGSAPGQIIEWETALGYSVVSSTFELFDAGRADLLGGAGEFDVSDNGGAGLSGTAVFGGAGLSQLGISGARATIVVQDVPAPAGGALLAGAGLLASRRRRR